MLYCTLFGPFSLCYVESEVSLIQYEYVKFGQLVQYMLGLIVMSPKNEHDESANFLKSKFVLKKEFIFKDFSTFN